jgi:glutamate dehydrogenase/leucine dehydrogenase
VSVVAAAAAVRPDLAGATVAVEGFDAAGGVALAAAQRLVDRGARITCIATTAGSAVRAEGFAPEELRQGSAEHGADVVAHLGGEPGKPWAALAAEVDLLLAGSKAGAITHDNAGYVKAAAVVPVGRVPVTAKALAILRRAGVVVLPDFVTLAGGGFAAWPTEPVDDPTVVTGRIEEAVAAVLGEVLDHADGPLLAAAYRAEAFLRTWQEQLPFGRPLA